MQTTVTNRATHFRAWRFLLSTILTATQLTACISIPRDQRQLVNRVFGNNGGINATAADQIGFTTTLRTTSFVTGGEPYQPTTTQSLDCGDPAIPLIVHWSSSDGVPSDNAHLACELALAAVRYDSAMAHQPPPAIGYRLQLVPTGKFWYGRHVGVGFFGYPRAVYGFHGNDQKVMQSEIANTIAHETLHIWAELFHVPKTRRAGIAEEQIAYLAGACADLAINGTLNAYDMAVPKPKGTTPSDATVAESIDRSKQGGVALNHELPRFFANGPILQRDSPLGHEFAAMCQSKLTTFFAP